MENSKTKSLTELEECKVENPENVLGGMIHITITGLFDGIKHNVSIRVSK